MKLPRRHLQLRAIPTHGQVHHPRLTRLMPLVADPLTVRTQTHDQVGDDRDDIPFAPSIPLKIDHLKFVQIQYGRHRAQVG